MPGEQKKIAHYRETERKEGKIKCHIIKKINVCCYEQIMLRFRIHTLA